MDAEAFKCREKVSHATVGIDSEARRPTAPETPSNAFERTLSAHVARPPLRPVVLVTVTLYRQTAIAISFNDKIDAVSDRANLRLHPIASRYQTIKNVALEVGVANRRKIAGGRHRFHRFVKVSYNLRFQIIRIQLCLAHGSHPARPDRGRSLPVAAVRKPCGLDDP
jgi:hypothetical protein